MKNKGMTLIEVLFATAIFSFVSIALFALFKLGQSYWGRGMSYNAIQNDMRKISLLLEKLIRQSSYKAIKCYNIIYGRTTRDIIIIPYYNEDNFLCYACFIATTDMDRLDYSGSLYYLEFITNKKIYDSDIGNYTDERGYLLQNNQNAVTNGDATLMDNRITKQSIDEERITLQITATGENIDHTRRTVLILLSDNLLDFDVQKNQNSRMVIIRMSFIKRTIGEGTNQVIQSFLYGNPLNNDSGIF